MNRELFISDFKKIFAEAPWEQIPDRIADYVEAMAKNKVHQKGICRVDKNKIIAFCCDRLSTTMEEMIRKDRREHIKVKRQITMLMLHRRGHISTPQIGKMFERNHATVLGSIRRIDGLMDTEPGMLEEIELLNAQL